MGSLLYCDMADQDCAEDYIEIAIAAWLLGGPTVALEFIAYQALCNDDTESLSIQDGDATMSTDSLLGIDTSEWFQTYKHLFETELYSGYIG